MRPRRLFQAAQLFILALAGISILSASTASISVPPSRLADTSRSITAEDLKPSDCAAITVTNLVSCAPTGNCNGSNGNDLILGSSRGIRINGRGGGDCIVGGQGNDTINGGPGTDICIGGPGADSFSNCETEIP